MGVLSFLEPLGREKLKKLLINVIVTIIYKSCVKLIIFILTCVVQLSHSVLQTNKKQKVSDLSLLLLLLLLLLLHESHLFINKSS